MKRLYNDSFQAKYKDERLKFCENLKGNYTIVLYTSISTKKKCFCLKYRTKKTKGNIVVLIANVLVR